jgi:hypothetical protein
VVTRFGGYGRLGHNSASDEMLPREITSLYTEQPQPQKQVQQRFRYCNDLFIFIFVLNSLIAYFLCIICSPQIREIFAGTTYCLAVSVSRHTYFFGILPNSPRGEASTYPRVMQELYDYPTSSVAGGSSWVMVHSDAAVIFWG